MESQSFKNRSKNTAQQKWKNTVKNAESDTEIVDSDHYPIIAKAKVKYKAAKTIKTQPRKKYEKATPKEKEEYNKKTGRNYYTDFDEAILHYLT